MEPIRDHFSRHNGSRLPYQDEESSLEGILGIVVAAENATTDAPDHWAVSAHEGCEGGVFSLFDEGRQELPIGQSRPVRAESDPPELVNEIGRLIHK